MTGSVQVAPSQVFNPAGLDWPREMTPADMDRVQVTAHYCALSINACVTDESSALTFSRSSIDSKKWLRRVPGFACLCAQADFVGAATRVQHLGADAVEMHVGHGYLLSQWLCPRTNVRTDGHGGCVENRMRYPLAILKAVRQAVGPKFTVLVKVRVYRLVSST